MLACQVRFKMTQPNWTDDLANRLFDAVEDADFVWNNFNPKFKDAEAKRKFFNKLGNELGFEG